LLSKISNNKAFVAEQITGKLAVLVHADIVGSTVMVQRDERRAHERITNAFQRFSETIQAYGGQVHEIRGDALLAEFSRASDAVCACLVFQQENTAHNKSLDDIVPEVRVGIALGEVVIADSTITGAGVVLAQRIEQLCEPGGVNITEAIREALPDRLPLESENLGKQDLKGFEKAVRVYRVVLKPGEAAPPPEKAPQRKATNVTGVSAAVAALVLLLAGGIALWLEPWQTEDKPASMAQKGFPLSDKTSIAVLPFINMSGDPEQGYFSDGITEDLITDLSKFSNLFVVSRGAAFRYKGKDVSPSQVGRELGIQYVLEGSVRRVGAKVRINAQLIEAASDGHIWAERYDRDLEGIFTLQDEIAERIATALKVKSTADEQQRVEQKGTEILEAYDSFLRGRALYWKFTAEANLQSRQNLEKAIELDPEYAAAYAELAHTRFQEWYFQYSKDPNSLDHGLEAALKAAALDDTSTLVYAMLGWIYNWLGNHDAAVDALERAILLDPNNANAHYYMAEAMMWAGKPKELARFTKEAMRIDPLYPFYYNMGLGMSYGMLREHEEAIAVFKGIIASKPNYLPARIRLAIVYGEMGWIDQARAEVAEILRLNPQANIQGLAQRLPYVDPGLKEHYLDALRTAGLPEQPE
jgi:adenylate cyclase